MDLLKNWRRFLYLKSIEFQSQCLYIPRKREKKWVPKRMAVGVNVHNTYLFLCALNNNKKKVITKAENEIICMFNILNEVERNYRSCCTYYCSRTIINGFWHIFFLFSCSAFLLRGEFNEKKKNNNIIKYTQHQLCTCITIKSWCWARDGCDFELQ